MKLICPLSGMVWEAEGFSTGHRKLQLQHPIFMMDLKGLVARITDWEAGRLSKEEKSLLFLSTLKYSDLVSSWLHPAMPSEKIVEENYLHLYKLVIWKEGILSPSLELPKFSINSQTYTLNNFHFWLTAWEGARKEFEAGVIKQKLNYAKSRYEEYLEAKIHRVELGTTGETAKYLRILANWASIAADFPTFIISHPVSQEDVTCSSYWIELICLPAGKIISDRQLQDLKELEDHLIDNLEDLSSLYAGALIKRVRKLVAGNTLDLGLELVELDEASMFPGARSVKFCSISSTGSTRYGIQQREDKEMEQAKIDIALNAPKNEPKEEDYPSKAKFIQAKIAWKFAQQMKN